MFGKQGMHYSQAMSEMGRHVTKENALFKSGETPGPMNAPSFRKCRGFQHDGYHGNHQSKGSYISLSVSKVSGVNAYEAGQSSAQYGDKPHSTEISTYMTSTLEMLAVTLDPVQTECMQKRRQALIEREN